MFLSDSELATLTGYTKPSAQARWLSSNGFPFLVGGDKKIKVLESLVLERLGGKSTPSKKEPQLRF